MLEEGEQKQYCEGVVEEAQVVTEEEVCECEGVRVYVRGSTMRHAVVEETQGVTEGKVCVLEGKYLAALEGVLHQLQRVGLQLQKSKCCFMAESVVYLGHNINVRGLHPVPDKVQGVCEAPECS